jgi:hypothetical protein
MHGRPAIFVAIHHYSSVIILDYHDDYDFNSLYR